MAELLTEDEFIDQLSALVSGQMFAGDAHHQMMVAEIVTTQVGLCLAFITKGDGRAMLPMIAAAAAGLVKMANDPDLRESTMTLRAEAAGVRGRPH